MRESVERWQGEVREPIVERRFCKKVGKWKEEG